MAAGTEIREIIVCPYTGHRHKENKVKQGYKPSKLIPSDILPAERRLLEDSTASPTALPTSDQMYKFLSLWEHFPFKPCCGLFPFNPKIT